MRALWAVTFLLAAASVGRAAEPPGKLVRETWDAAFLDGQKAGHYRTTVHEIAGDGSKFLRVRRELRLSVKRGPDLARIHAETGNDETPDGKLLAISHMMTLGTNQQLRISGKVIDGVLHDSVEGPQGNKSKTIPLPDDLMTLLGEESLVQRRKAQPGDRMSYRLFEPTINNVIRVEVEVKDHQEVSLDGANRKLLRVLTKPERIEGVQLPTQTLWYDDAFRLVQSQSEIPGLGVLTLRRTSKEKALAPPGKLRDMMDQSVMLDRTIRDPHRLKKIVFRVTFTREFDDPAEEAKELPELLAHALAPDGKRQSLANAADRSVELTVAAVRTPPAKDPGAKIDPIYLNSNFFINSDDAKVRELAADAAGDIADPWRKALSIERYVKNNMQAMAFTEALAPADVVARTLKGDCTEFAMLTAAMCRAQKIPSRTAIGLVYYEDKSVPKMGYHMWTEVFIRGEWLGLDATLGRGGIGPAHVKITDHSWHETRSTVPLLPVMRVLMARPRVEVLRAE